MLARAFWIASRIPIGLIGKTSRAFVSRTTVGFFNPSIKCRPTSKRGRCHQGQPQARQVWRQHRHRDQPAPQPLLPGVFSDHAAVSGDIRAADLEDAALAWGQILRRQEVGQHVVHGDGLGRRRQPTRAEHDRQSVGQRLDQIEGQAARADHQGGPELDGFHAGISKDLADLMAAAQDAARVSGRRRRPSHPGR